MGPTAPKASPSCLVVGVGDMSRGGGVCVGRWGWSRLLLPYCCCLAAAVRPLLLLNTACSIIETCWHSTPKQPPAHQPPMPSITRTSAPSLTCASLSCMPNSLPAAPTKAMDWAGFSPAISR